MVGITGSAVTSSRTTSTGRSGMSSNTTPDSVNTHAAASSTSAHVVDFARTEPSNVTVATRTPGPVATTFVPGLKTVVLKTWVWRLKLLPLYMDARGLPGPVQPEY